MLQELPKWDTEAQSQRMLLKNGTRRLAECRVATDFCFVKMSIREAQ